MNALESFFSSNKERIFEEWKALLRIQSISTEPAFANHCREGAQWVSKHLAGLGFNSEIIETSGHPVVFAQRRCAKADAPTLLFYGHYDVQPVDPLDLWHTEPFSPVEKDGRMYARGAQDNKGQLFYFLKAVEATKDSCGVNIKVLIEGEEEIGSKRLMELLPSLKSKLSADVLLVCDTGTVDEKVGAITVGLRGIGHFEVKLVGPNKDLHSGVHGGVVRNPAIELCRLVSKLHDENGKIAVPGYFDGALPITEEERRYSGGFNFPPELYRQKVGVLPEGGEKGVPMMERRGLHPTIEINGMYSGYLGEGSKTIIPSFAVCKISCRLVAGQPAETAIGKVVDFLRANTPKEMKLDVSPITATGGALKVPLHGRYIEAATDSLKAVMGSDPIYLWEGASIPLISELSNCSGSTPVLVGFGLEEDNIHAPNESFSLEQFYRGFLFCGNFLSAVGNEKTV